MAWVIACILAAAALPYAFLVLSGVPSSSLPSRWDRAYDNHDPRASLARLQGFRKRAHYAQLNGHEAFAPFAIGMLCAQWVNVAPGTIRSLGVGFVLIRLLYGALYVVDRPTLRSAVWGLGILDVLALYVTALVAVT